jgi:hypothetical protein
MKKDKDPELKPKPNRVDCSGCNGEKVFDEFLEDVENDMKMERYKQFWDKHKKWMSFLATIAISGTLLIAFWQKYDAEQREEIATQLISAINLVEEGKDKEAAGLLTHIGGRYQNTYKFLAKLARAGILQKDAQNAEEAQGLYMSVMSGRAPAYIKELASILYVNSLLQKNEKIDDETGKKMRDILKRYRVSKNGFALLRREIEGLVAFKCGNLTEARQAFDEISKNEKTPQGMYMRVSLMIQAIQDQEEVKG